MTKNKLKIYSTHPYIAVVKGRTYHLTKEQWQSVIDAMAERESKLIINYKDPATNRTRQLPLTLHMIEELDEAYIVQKNNWLAQRGYVCMNGRLVDEQSDCVVKQKWPTQPSIFAKALTGNARLQLERKQASHLVAGFICGHVRRGEKYIPDYVLMADYASDMVIEKIKVYAKTDKIREDALKLWKSLYGRRKTMAKRKVKEAKGGDKA